MSQEVVHIILTCTKRKTRPPAPGLELRQVLGATPEARAAAWIERLRSHQGDRLPISDLYAGDHWQVGRSLQDVAAATGRRAVAWVCSAGYGLLALDARVAPYSATFSQNHADSISHGMAGLHLPAVLQRWWETLAAWRGPVPGAPRTIAGIAERDPGAAIWIIASAPYLRAMASDVASAAALADSTRLTIFSAGARSVRQVEPFLLPFDLRMRAKVGGAAMALNVRVARELLLGTRDLARPALLEALAAMGEGLGHPTVPQRAPMTDEEVRSFLRTELRAKPGLRCTPLLRRLRDVRNGACEQKRFGELYRQVREGMPIVQE